MSNLSFTERTARLVIVITVIGALALLNQKAFLFFFKALSNKIYLPFLISYEHIIISCILSSGLLLLCYLISYVYAEFFALNSNIPGTPRASTADQRYDLLFRLIQYYTILTFIFNLFFIIVLGFFVKNFISIGFTIFFLLMFLISLLFKNVRAKLPAGMKFIWEFVKSNWKYLLIWVGVTFTSLFLIIVFMNVSQKSFFTAKFLNDQKASIKFHFENSIPEKITLSYYSVDKNDKELLTKELEINKNKFRRSFIEVTEKQESSNTVAIVKVIDDEIYKGSKEAYLSNKSNYEYNYEIYSIEHLKQGKNYVVIQFKVGNLNNYEYFNIVNEVHLDEKNILLINKEEFRENLKR